MIHFVHNARSADLTHIVIFFYDAVLSEYEQRDSWYDGLLIQYNVMTVL